MAKEKSDTSKYESRYGGGFVSGGQYIAEIMCERIAKKDGRGLPVKFWNLPTWKKIFMQQLLASNGLLKLYHSQAILSALRKDTKAYSLRAPWLDDIIKEEQMKLDAIPIKSPDKVVVEPIMDKQEKPRDSFSNKQSTLKKLRELDE